MNPQSASLKQLVDRVRSRIQWRDVFKGVAIAIAAGAVTLLVVALIASRYPNRPVLMGVIRWLPFLFVFAAGWLFVLRPLRNKIDDARIARLIEEKGALADRLVTSVEYSSNTGQASPAIVDRLISDTSTRAASLNLDSVVDARRTYAYGGIALLILLVTVSMFFFGPRKIKGGISTLYSGGDEVSANSMFISVAPGNAKVPRGSDQKIKATLSGFDSSLAQVFVRNVGAENWAAHVMEPAKNAGEFQFVMFNIQDSASYYVESNGIRSPEFGFVVADLPFVKQLDLLLDFPAYTHLASKKIENGGEVAALKGTIVHVTARMTAQAKAARIVLSDGTRIEMSPDAEDRFTAEFVVKHDGTYKIEITSDGGDSYNGSNEYDITVLEDHPPSVLLDKPGRDMKVTSIQEIFSQVRAEDDYGVASIELHYSVNGGEEKTVKLQDLHSDSPRTLSGAHTFFLEEFGLQPGDFISYYAKARDNSSSPNESTSDIYFLEVRPFDRQFRQAQQQGGGKGEDDSANLTGRQRKIIASTFRVQREIATYTPQEKDENLNAITLSEEKLKTDTDALVERIRRRLGDQINSQPDFAKLVEYLGQASKEMTAAAVELRAQKTKEAMPPEERALQQLLRAEAVFRDIQIARGQQGQGNQNEQQELADLFELQLDKMKNQYETVQQDQQSEQNKQQDEIARRLEELARRQQQQVEQRMRSEMQQGGGGGGGGSQRQQQETIDELKKMARELERLSRDRRDQKLAETAQQLQQAAEDMQRAQAGSSSRNNAEATAQSMRALERLQQAQRMLESAQRAGGQQSVQKLRQQTEEALKRQDEITRSVEEMARGQNGSQSQQKKDQLAEKKQGLADKMSGLERDIDQAARSMGGDREASDKLREAAGNIRKNRIPDRIRQINQLIESGAYDAAREREKMVRGNIEEVLKNLQAAEGSSGKRNQAESLEEAMNRARELAENLESLRRRLESQQGQQSGPQQSQQQGQQQQAGQQQGQQQGGRQQNGRQQGGQQQGQQQAGQQQGGRQQGGRQQGGQQQGGQQQGGQQQAGQQQGGRQQGGQQQGGQQQGGQQQAGQQQGGRQQGGQQQGGQQQAGQQQGGRQQGGQQQGGQQASAQGNPQGGAQAGGRPSGNQDPQDSNGGGPINGARQLESELRQRIAEAEDLKRILGRDPELTRDLNRAIEQLRRIDPNAFSDPAQLALLKNEVIEPVRQVEIELARKLQAKLGNNGAGAFGDGDAPERYRKVIEDYYRRLSARSPDAKP